jgi:hypothetical protein
MRETSEGEFGSERPLGQPLGPLPLLLRRILLTSLFFAARDPESVFSVR